MSFIAPAYQGTSVDGRARVDDSGEPAGHFQGLPLKWVGHYPYKLAANQLEGVPLGEVAVVDATWSVIAANCAWSETVARYGLSDLLGVGQNFARFCEWCEAEGTRDGTALLGGLRAIDENRIESFRHTCNPANAQFRQISISTFRYDGERFATISNYDTEELFRMSARLVEAHTDLLQARDKERAHLARELHDGSAQYLTAISLGVLQLEQTSSDPAVRAIADDLSELIEQLHRELRGLTYLLHPPQLQAVGLHGAMKSLCGGLTKRSGLDVRIQAYGEDQMQSPLVEAAAYRICQEALTNIHRHARATHVRVRLCSRAGSLLLTVEDDGVGFSQQTAPSGKQEFGVGLQGMVERVHELGGHFVVRNSRRGRGTFLGAVLPRQ